MGIQVHYTYDYITLLLSGLAYVVDPALVPVNTTTVVPSSVSGYWPKWNPDTQTWDQIEDHRGSVWVKANGVKLNYTEVGALPDTLTTIPKPDGMYTWDAPTNSWVAVSISPKWQAILDYLKAGVAAGVLTQSEVDALQVWFPEIMQAVVSITKVPVV